jgi:hypothetical protein
MLLSNPALCVPLHSASSRYELSTTVAPMTALEVLAESSPYIQSESLVSTYALFVDVNSGVNHLLTLVARVSIVPTPLMVAISVRRQ